MSHRIKRALTGVAIAVLVCLASVIGVGWHAGYRIYVVHTGSMSPTLRPGDAVLDGPAPASPRSGQIVTFRITSGPDSVVTHRVASVAEGAIRTKGDANQTVDPWTLHVSQIVGSATLLLPHVGYVLFYLRQPQGIASVATLALGIALLWGLFFPARDETRDVGDPSISGPAAPRHLAV